ncbi:MAG: DMT family transporter [Kiritimatiellaceae bacterium]|nr:MAG: DMT family transporter [Kiritimatiellaceae bacterium]
MWIGLGLCSMLFLGVYDLCKKRALRENSVLPTLFVSNLAGCLLLGVVVLMAWGLPGWAGGEMFRLGALPWGWHAWLAGKAVVVGISWICAFLALKHLPLSIASPIRASAPAWTLLGALTLFGETPSGLQWMGMGIILLCYVAFSFVGREEGIRFERNGWVWLMVLATVIGTCSTLLDKFLLHYVGMAAMEVLLWYAFYLLLFFTVLTGVWWWPRRREQPLRWHGAMPCIGLALILADFFYFVGLADEGALLVVLSMLRRSSVVISFVGAGLFFGDVNLRQKGWVLGGILLGVLFILASGV